MNKKIIALIALSLNLSLPLFSMNALVYRTAKIIGRGALPLAGAGIAYKINKNLAEFNEKIELIKNDDPIKFGGMFISNKVSPEVEKFVRDSLRDAGCADAETIKIVSEMDPLSFSKDLDEKRMEASVFGKVLIIDNDLIAHRLKYSSCYISFLDRLFLDKDSLEYKKRKFEAELEDREKKLKETYIILAHETKHYNNQDSRKGTYAFAGIPLAIEASCAAVTGAFRKHFGIKQPQTILKTVLRSSCAIGAIAPKQLLNVLACMGYSRYQESGADRYACEHARDRKDLEAFYAYFNEAQERYGLCNEYLTTHPPYAKRKAMTQSYMDKWDREHPKQGKEEAC